MSARPVIADLCASLRENTRRFYAGLIDMDEWYDEVARLILTLGSGVAQPLPAPRVGREARDYVARNYTPTPSR